MNPFIVPSVGLNPFQVPLAQPFAAQQQAAAALQQMQMMQQLQGAFGNVPTLPDFTADTIAAAMKEAEPAARTEPKLASESETLVLDDDVALFDQVRELKAARAAKLENWNARLKACGEAQVTHQHLVGEVVQAMQNGFRDVRRRVQPKHAVPAPAPAPPATNKPLTLNFPLGGGLAPSTALPDLPPPDMHPQLLVPSEDVFKSTSASLDNWFNAATAAPADNPSTDLLPAQIDNILNMFGPGGLGGGQDGLQDGLPDLAGLRIDLNAYE